MTFLFFDTETTGLPLWNKPSGSAGQPHLVQLAAIHDIDDDNSSQMCRIISPEGAYEIPDEVVAVHGITTERAEDEGVPLKEAIDEWLDHLRSSDMLVGFNISFDKRIIRIQLKRLGLDTEADVLKQMPSACAMVLSRPICRLPPTAKMRGGFKSPNLGEAYQHFFDETLEGAHDALIDVQACRKIYYHIMGSN